MEAQRATLATSPCLFTSWRWHWPTWTISELYHLKKKAGQDKVTQWTGCVLANTRSHQLCLVDWEMETVISRRQVAGFIHVITSSTSKAASIHIAVLLIFDRDHHMLSMYMYMTVVADHLSLCPRVYIANGWDSVDSAKNIARKKNCSLDNLTGRNGSYSTSQVLLCICRVPSSSSSITLSTFRCICMPQGVGQC